MAGAMNLAPAAPAPTRLSGPRNRVLPLLAAVAIAGGAGSGFVSLAPNRLVSGQPVFLWQRPAVPASMKPSR